MLRTGASSAIPLENSLGESASSRFYSHTPLTRISSFRSSLVSVASAAFDSYIGFILWAVVYIKLNRGNLWHNRTLLGKAETALNYFLIPAGLFLLGPGVRTTDRCSKRRA